VAYPEAAVDRYDGSGDVAGCGRGQESDEASHSGVANRPSGTPASTSARRRSGRSAVMSVCTKPGATTFAVMEREPSSRASERARPISPALAAA